MPRTLTFKKIDFLGLEQGTLFQGYKNIHEIIILYFITDIILEIWNFGHLNFNSLPMAFIFKNSISKDLDKGTFDQVFKNVLEEIILYFSTDISAGIALEIGNIEYWNFRVLQGFLF